MDGRMRAPAAPARARSGVTSVLLLAALLLAAAHGQCTVVNTGQSAYALATDAASGSMLVGSGSIVTSRTPAGARAVVAQGFYQPFGVAVSSDGTLFVADTSNQRIAAITPGGVISNFAGGGSWGTQYGSADGMDTTALFYYPQAVAVSTVGTLFVADSSNNKVRAITPGGNVTTLAGGGSSGTQYGSADGMGTTALFHHPAGTCTRIG